MRCPKCNSAIPIGGEVCNKCGYNVYTKKQEQIPSKPNPQVDPPKPVPQSDPPKPVPQPNPPKPIPQPQPKPKAKSKGGKWIVTLAVTLLACVIGRCVGGIAGRALAQDWRSDSSRSSSYQESAIEETVNPAFDTLLSSHGLSYTPKIYTMNSECFASELEGGIVEVLEYGYAGDIVKEQIDTLFYPLEGYSDSDVELIKSNAQALFGEMTNTSYATVEYSTQGNYYVITMRFEKLDDASTIQKMTDDGWIERDAATGKTIDYISLKKTAETLIANGSIQR